MKANKLLPYATLLIIVLSGAFACNDNDGYSLGDFRISIATVIPEGTMTYSLLLDNGDKLLPTHSAVQYSPIDNQRVFVNYTLLTDKEGNYDHLIRVNDIWDVLTKPVIELTEANADSIGNDPVRANEFWIGNDFLNASFSFNYGGVKPHAINMVQNMQDSDEKDDDVLELELRHNSYNSASNRLFDGFASFDLKPFRKEGEDSIPVIIKVKDWDGDKEYRLTYKYNELNKPRTQATIPNISTNEYE